MPTLHLDLRDLQRSIETEEQLVALLVEAVNLEHPLVAEALKFMPEFASLPQLAAVKDKTLAHGQPGVTLSSTLNLLESLMRRVHRVNSQPSVFGSFVSFITGYRPLPPRKYAAVFIDEVQGLKPLFDTEEGKLALTELFLWAVEINKDKSTGHVFFASSDAFFLQFMRDNLLKPEYLDVFVLDDAPLDTAKAVLEKEGPFSAAEAEQLVAVVGGRLKDVSRAVSLKQGRNLTAPEILEQLENDVRGNIQQGLDPQGSCLSGGPCQWSAAQFAKAVRLLSEVEYGVVSKERMVREALDGDEQALRSMVQKEAFAQLPFLSLEERHKEWKSRKPKGEVIKAQSPLLLYHWQQAAGL